MPLVRHAWWRPWPEHATRDLLAGIAGEHTAFVVAPVHFDTLQLGGGIPEIREMQLVEQMRCAAAAHGDWRRGNRDLDWEPGFR